MSKFPYTISQSLIRKFLRDGDEIPLCPKNLYYTELTKEYEIPPTLPMLHGSYFETLVLGSGRDGEKVKDLPRKKLTQKQGRENKVRAAKGEELMVGGKTVAQIRIEEQAERFNILRAQKQMMIVPEYNTQVKILKRWKEDESVVLSGTLDIFPTPILGKDGLQMAIVDLKLTGDIDNEFGGFPWGTPERMDHIQGKMYHYLVREVDFELNPHLKNIITKPVRNIIADNNVLFLYWVFSYSSGDLRDKFVRYDWDYLKEKELHESIRKTISFIEFYEKKGWPAEPEYERCANCPLVNCTERCEIQAV